MPPSAIRHHRLFCHNPRERLRFEHVVVGIQAVGPEYFTNDDVQHCILERPDKTLYVVPY